ncbi:HlyD family type I secretion periplasmic adaptor subunit [Pseudovibrio sp. SPO723]|uniref:HlyD family type I secretion periplasmic adaptor subunit n=1 Tax=Nesiotobacter zosterae TaxID=392721 RepID=UPI0029C3AD98|nr:HlyD family type I secretion periplasmic adaptor subunit [Pseudovibrio sp. SPO723]MDX5593418.1 HlyD family type I secretion periplasmic adaptor subunit [Pseudovibrio sp. SPO723]
MTTRSLILDSSWYEDVPRSTTFPILASLVVVLVTFVGFGVWASTAPMAGAVVATGSFVATGQNKIIQHLEGGIIEEILVREGDIVEEGDVLLRLDPTAPQANLARLQIRQARLEAVQTRLVHEGRGITQISWPEGLEAHRDDPRIHAILLNQALTFQARSKRLQSEIDILQQSIDALEEKVTGGKTQRVAVKEQMALFAEELETKREMLKSGLIRKSEVLGLERAMANLRGEVGRITAEIGDATERIARTRAQIAKARHEASQFAVDELQAINADLDDVREQIFAAKDVLKRIEIKAPVRGAVIRMRYHTAGGVVESGKDLMEILPLQDDLVIEANIHPADIDNVRKGQKAMVRMNALNQRTTPMLPAQVIYVSADALPDERRSFTASDVYVARVKLDPQAIADVIDFQATPGMPAEVYITTRDRTFIDYLLEPLQDSMARAFREP